METAWLTPAFNTAEAYTGQVHSVFDRVVNLALHCRGETRLFTLCAPGLARLPDAARVPPGWLDGLAPGMSARLCCGRLTVGTQTLRLARSPWHGEIPVYGKINETQYKRLEAASLKHAGGLYRLPQAARLQAFCAIRAGDVGHLLGLGPGLTPAFDDACVGAMAARRALGAAAPFRLNSLTNTTDISARYLQLAAEGYFGEPLCELVAAVYGAGDFACALKRLLTVGATSGRDMLVGVWLAMGEAMETDFSLTRQPVLL